jgi:hypothetical protein
MASVNDPNSELVLRPSQATNRKKPCLLANPPSGKSHRTIVVLGVERGGTSMVAGVLRALGINMGERAGLNHEDPRFLSDDQERLDRLIKQRNKELEVWGFKVPKSALMLEFYKQRLRNPYYIVVFRNIAAIADSWVQRGASREYVSPIERTMVFYNKIYKFIKDTHSPLILVNYERAAQCKEELVRDLAEFVEVSLRENDLKRAAAVITGDGKGYVNLPEHYFIVEPKDRILSEHLLSSPFPCNKALNIVDDGPYQHFLTQENKIILTRIGDSYFPNKFLMVFDFDAPDTLDLQSNIFRIYFDFIEEFFPGHATRPDLKLGKNILFVETNGKVRGIAIGAMLPDIRGQFANIAFYKLPVEVDLNSYMTVSTKLPHQSQSQSNYFTKLRDRLRALIKQSLNR